VYWDLLLAGYFREGSGFAERWLELEPLSPAAHYAVFQALFALGRESEAIRSLELSIQLGNEEGNWDLGVIHLRDKQYEIGITHIEAFLQQDRLATDWVRELVGGASDPETGQAYLDRRIPEIVASVPKENANLLQMGLATWYLYFGFLDRFFERIHEIDSSLSAWNNAEISILAGTITRRSGFTADPRYLEIAERGGLFEAWEQRGPPDFCEKLGGQWVCE
jgi:tetratricopeptide (TPR) repeat protein